MTIIRCQWLLYAVLTAVVLYALALSGHRMAGYGWLLLALVAFLAFQAPVAVRMFYTRWWRPGYR